MGLKEWNLIQRALFVDQGIDEQFIINHYQMLAELGALRSKSCSPATFKKMKIILDKHKNM